jgi:hypothetical protein
MSPLGDRETQSRWFQLAISSRWPVALVLSAWSVANAAVAILKQPIPIGLPLDQPLPVKVHGALKIEGISSPITVSASTPLAVQGKVAVAQPISVKASEALAVRSSSPLQVSGSVDVDAIKEPVAVDRINKEIKVDVSNDEPLQVNGTVGVEQVGGRINVTLRNAVKSVAPIPLP